MESKTHSILTNLQKNRFRDLGKQHAYQRGKVSGKDRLGERNLYTLIYIYIFFIIIRSSTKTYSVSQEIIFNRF